MRRIWTAIFASVGMLLLILDAKTALMGAAEGIDLCIRSVIPSLFPFFVLSMLLTGALSGTSLPFLCPLGRLCGVPEGGESLLLVGFLGGYPVGAQTVAQQYRDGTLDKFTARRLLGFCSNAGPAFLFGIVAARFSAPWMGWALWGIHILSALLVGAFLQGKATASVRLERKKPVTLSEALRRSISVMAQVCGWVILFRVLIAFLSRWILWLLPQAAQVVLTGLLELTNGCCSLARIADEGVRFVAASGLLAFGGLCVTMQTLSVTEGLGIGTYLRGKLFQTLLSIALAWIVINRDVTPAVLLALGAILLREIKKRSSNPAAVGV